jgi:ribonuclease T2
LRLTIAEISQATGKELAAFSGFLLTLSWAPDFCASNPKERSSAECDPKQHMGLVVRGLWPQYDNGK